MIVLISGKRHQILSFEEFIQVLSTEPRGSKNEVSIEDERKSIDDWRKDAKVLPKAERAAFS